MQLVEMFVHPLKSCRGISYSRAYASKQGLLHDREWLLAGDNGRFFTARSHPQLVRVEVDLIPGGALFKYPGKPPILAMSTQYQQEAAATVWKDSFTAYHGDRAVDHWFSELLGEPCQLLWLGMQSQRRLKDSEHAMSFADGYPYLLVNQASLDALNDELDQPVSLRHFRPNLVVSGEYAWEEDDWKVIQIGDVVFDVAKPCSRCVLTTVDPDTGIKSSEQQPLRTLVSIRTLPEGVCFGVNLVPRNEGALELGAEFRVLESRYEF